MSPNKVESGILQSLWKWKLLSMAAIAEESYGCQYSEAAYKRILGMKERGLVERVCLIQSKAFVWSLTSRGLASLKNFLPDLREVGFRSEAPAHDYLCTALQRGPWLTSTPENVTLVSEQELRRCYPEHLPPILSTSSFHRADGYTIVTDPQGASVTAIEVELNKKNPADYAAVGSFYSPDEVTRVLWLVPTKSMAEWVLARLTTYRPERSSLHQFVLVSDFQSELWNAAVCVGAEFGRRIHQLFDQPDSPCLLRGEIPAALDLRLRTYSSKLYPKSPDRNFLNRVALQASRPSTSNHLSDSSSLLSNVSPAPYSPLSKTQEVFLCPN